MESGPFYDAVWAALRTVDTEAQAPTRIIAETLKTLGQKARLAHVVPSLRHRT